MTATNTTKPLIIYHDNCADGFGAAWAAYRKFGTDGAEYLPMQYNDPRVHIDDDELVFPTQVEGRDVFILDFSFPPSIHFAISDLANITFHRDHHKTAFEAYGFDPNKRFVMEEGGESIILDPNKSGCVLAWELFHSATPPTILELIQDRDLWQWKLDGTKDFATALRSKPFSFEWFDEAMLNVEGLMADGAAMNRLFDQQLADITKHPTLIDLFGTEDTGLAVNCTPQFASEAGNTLAKQSGTYGATWCVGEHGQVFFSLRSIGEYDVSAIAKRFGGGGHRNAAGFRTTLDRLMFAGEALIVSPIPETAESMEQAATTPQPQISQRLRTMATDMQEISIEMAAHSGAADWSYHAKQLSGAADIALEWADSIEAECQTKNGD